MKHPAPTRNADARPSSDLDDVIPELTGVRLGRAMPFRLTWSKARTRAPSPWTSATPSRTPAPRPRHTFVRKTPVRAVDTGHVVATS